jgi:hypothetical protein
MEFVVAAVIWTTVIDCGAVPIGIPVFLIVEF